MANEMITMQGLTNQANAFLDYLGNVRSEQEMKKVFAQLAALKAALLDADLFRAASVQYAKLEAEALVRAVELNDGNPIKLNGQGSVYRAKAALWLYGLSAEERDQMINKCMEGMTIDKVYKAVVYSADGEEYKKALNRYVEKKISELNENGSTNISTYAWCNDEEFKKVPKEYMSGIVELTRHRVRGIGAVGLGDQYGTYVLPKAVEKPEAKNEIIEAIDCRLESIANDLSYLAEILYKTTKNNDETLVLEEEGDQDKNIAKVALCALACTKMMFKSKDSMERIRQSLDGVFQRCSFAEHKKMEG